MIFWLCFMAIIICITAIVLLCAFVNHLIMYNRPPKTSLTPSRTYDAGLYKTKAWKELRWDVINRAKGRCQMCGEMAETAHHLTYREGVLCRPELLMAVCWDCHHHIHERHQWN